MLTDNSIIASVLLLNCFLDDMRKGREDKLNRLIQRSHVDQATSVDNLHSSVESLSSRSMIDVVVQIAGDQIFTDVKVYSFTLILSVDYLLKIADFLKIEENGTETVKVSVSQSKTTAIAAAKVQAAAVQETQSTQQITLNLKIEKPDIILVEHMDNIDTKALILNVNN